MTDKTLTEANEGTLRLVDAIISGKATDIESTFSSAMAERIGKAIDEREELVQKGLLDEWKTETPWMKVKSKSGSDRGRVANLSDKAQKKSAADKLAKKEEPKREREAHEFI